MLGENKRILRGEQKESLMKLLELRFQNHMHRHEALDWNSVREKLEQHPEKLWSLNEMERTGGEPDVVGFDRSASAYIFYDCCPESPIGRRSLCYDQEALESRKEHKPQGSAVGMAAFMGIDLLTEDQYRRLQELDEFDTKTSSWIATPARIRTLGGALFCDRRYQQVFVYHNGAESYYAVRGFRGSLGV